MNKRLTLASNEFGRFRKPTRRERFLTEMNAVVPWAELCALIEPYYPQAGSPGGRPAVGLERMLRIHCLQLWFDLSDPAVEEALYDSRAMRAFVGIDPGREPVPDETTVVRFRHLLEHNGLGEKIFEEVGRGYCSVAGSRSRRARSWTPRSSPPRVRRRTPRAAVTPRCTRRRRATSGTSG